MFFSQNNTVLLSLEVSLSLAIIFVISMVLIKHHPARQAHFEV